MIVRIIGALLVIGALTAAGFEIAGWASSGKYAFITLGDIWYATHKASLNTSQAVVQRYVAPWLWDPAIMWVLLRPAWASVGLPGLLLLWLGRRRKKGKRRFRRPH